MGYCIRMNRANFFIAQKDKKAALQRIRDLKGKGTIQNRSGFSWVDEGFEKATNLVDMFDKWRYIAKQDEDDNIIGLEFVGEKIGVGRRCVGG